MVYSVMLKWLSFKIDISSLAVMIENQQETYAVLRYAHDIPDLVFKEAMNKLLSREEWIHHRKLLKLVSSYKKIQKPILEIEEDELVETIEVGVGYKDEDDIFMEYDESC